MKKKIHKLLHKIKTIIYSFEISNTKLSFKFLYVYNHVKYG